MNADDITLRLVDMTLPFSGIAYLLLGLATLVLAIRFRSWSAAVSCAGFVYIAVVKFTGFGWSMRDDAASVAPHWLDMLSRFQAVALMLSAVFLLFFVVGRKSRRDPDSRRTS